MIKLILLLIALSLHTLAFSQVYPYSFSPIPNSSEGTKYGLVDVSNNKITEPIFGKIKPFIDQENNNYTLFYTKVESYERTSPLNQKMNGIINKKGEIIIQRDASFDYDGNGKIATYYADTMLHVYNLDKKKVVYSSKTYDVMHVAPSIPYSILLYDRYAKMHTVIDENGRPWSLQTKPTQDVKLHSVSKGKAIYKVKQTGPNDFAYYDGQGNLTHPEEEVLMEYEGTDMVMEEDYTGEEDVASILASVQAMHPEYRVGNAFKRSDGSVRFIEIYSNVYVGLVNTKGDIILSPNFTKIWTQSSDFDGDKQDDHRFLQIFEYNKIGLLNESGELIVPILFGLFQFDPTVNLFWIHGPKGYAGYGDENGKLFLPKECECVN